MVWPTPARLESAGTQPTLPAASQPGTQHAGASRPGNKLHPHPLLLLAPCSYEWGEPSSLQRARLKAGREETPPSFPPATPLHPCACASARSRAVSRLLFLSGASEPAGGEPTSVACSSHRTGLACRYFQVRGQAVRRDLGHGAASTARVPHPGVRVGDGGRGPALLGGGGGARLVARAAQQRRGCRATGGRRGRG